MPETLEQKVRRVCAEEVSVAPYDPSWPRAFEEEKQRLIELLPADLIIRIEHFGSTAVPGLVAKPIVDMRIELNDAESGRVIIPERLEPLGYDCFWRPLGNENIPPFYTWAIRRDAKGARTHHLHFVTPDLRASDLPFRDMLIADRSLRTRYSDLKRQLSEDFSNDRIAYTQAKGAFIQAALEAKSRCS